MTQCHEGSTAAATSVGDGQASVWVWEWNAPITSRPCAPAVAIDGELLAGVDLVDERGVRRVARADGVGDTAAASGSPTSSPQPSWGSERNAVRDEAAADVGGQHEHARA